jgi:ATP-binding cassette subfamily C (CFTR/MRP) protein 1
MSALEMVGFRGTVLANRTLDDSLHAVDLSPGQGQLFCIARILIVKPKILILDEATSSLDHRNEQIIQRLIREEFLGCTIVAITHRLQNIVDFDAVAIMEEGRVMEIGRPSELLSDPGTRFAKLCK